MSGSAMRGSFVPNNFPLPSVTERGSRHAALGDVIAAPAPPAAKSAAVSKLAGAMFFNRRPGMNGAWMGADAAGTLDTSSASGFVSSVMSWVQANPLLAGAGALGAFFLLRKGRR